MRDGQFEIKGYDSDSVAMRRYGIYALWAVMGSFAVAQRWLRGDTLLAANNAQSAAFVFFIITMAEAMFFVMFHSPLADTFADDIRELVRR